MARAVRGMQDRAMQYEDKRDEPAPIPPAPPPRSMRRRDALMAIAAIGSVGSGLGACGGGGSGGGDAPPPAPSPPAPPPPVVITPVDGPAWPGFARNAQHTAIGAIATRALDGIVWSTRVDLYPPYTSGGALLAHYGSPVITRRNTVVLPVKIDSNGPFRIEARTGQTGGLVWSEPTAYRLPAHNWVPAFQPVLAASSLGGASDVRAMFPTSGGRIVARETPDSATGLLRTLTFYGDAAYAAAPASFDATVFVNTPLTADSAGNVWFGYTVSSSNPAGLAGGIARIAADGTGSWVEASVASADAALVKTAMNCAPALSADEGTLYVVVNSIPTAPARARGMLLALDATTLATRARAPLIDPVTATPAWVNDNATSSPLVGPDGDVYIGVLEANPPAHGFRGWLLHFDAALATARTPANFGWDNTPSIVPASMLTQYAGPSSYLLAIKSNSYGGIGAGDGRHRVAIVDPRQTQADVFSSATVMREVITILGPTPDPNYPGGVKEWCINTCAVDPLTSSILINSEDGILYRWHLPTNSFTERLPLNNGYAQAYTPTAIGADGRVYAVNNATLFCVGR
jgi:hypothetical protein